MWNLGPNFFFRAFAYLIVFLKYTNGSPPVIPAPFALDSIASLISSLEFFIGLSFAYVVGEFFLFLDREQYQQFREHLPPMNRTSFSPLTQNLQPLHTSELQNDSNLVFI